jgi:membrane protein
MRPTLPPSASRAVERARRRAAAELDRRPALRRRSAQAGDLVDACRRHRLSGLAAEVAFWATLSIFPALLAVAAALGSVDALVGTDAAERTRAELVDGVTELLGGTASGVASTVDGLFDRPRPSLVSVGLVALVWAASRAFTALIRALDVIYGVDERRSWVRVRLTGLGLALGSLAVGSLVLAAVVVGPLLGRGPAVSEAVGLGDAFATAWTWVRLPVAALVLVAWATTIFHLAPDHRTPWRWDLPGALLTMGLWLVGHLGLLAYLSLTAGSTNAVFGVLGGALTLLLWLFVLAAGALLGAELNAAVARWRRADPGSYPTTLSLEIPVTGSR